MAVVVSWPLKSSTLQLDSSAIFLTAASAPAPRWLMVAITSYQAPVRARASSGWAFKTLVLTTQRFWISPGMLDESNPLVTPLALSAISITIGFQVTQTCWLLEAMKEGAMSESLTFMIVTSASVSPFFSSPRDKRYWLT